MAIIVRVVIRLMIHFIIEAYGYSEEEQPHHHLVIVVVYIRVCVACEPNRERDHPVLRFGYPTMRGLNQSRVSKTPVTRTRRAYASIRGANKKKKTVTCLYQLSVS